MKKNLYEILIPVLDNDKKEFNWVTVVKWQKLLLEISGGYTVFPSCDGVWLNEGRTCYDTNTPYRVCVTEEECIDLLKYAKDVFRQITIMAYKISDDVIFYSGT